MEERHKELEGDRFEVLVGGVSKRDKSKLAGRTRTGRIVAFEGDESLVGKFVDVIIESSTPLTLFGHLEGVAQPLLMESGSAEMQGQAKQSRNSLPGSARQEAE